MSAVVSVAMTRSPEATDSTRYSAARATTRSSAISAMTASWVAQEMTRWREVTGTIA